MHLSHSRLLLFSVSFHVLLRLRLFFVRFQLDAVWLLCLLVFDSCCCCRGCPLFLCFSLSLPMIFPAVANHCSFLSVRAILSVCGLWVRCVGKRGEVFMVRGRAGLQGGVRGMRCACGCVCEPSVGARARACECGGGAVCVCVCVCVICKCVCACKSSSLYYESPKLCVCVFVYVCITIL